MSAEDLPLVEMFGSNGEWIPIHGTGMDDEEGQYQYARWLLYRTEKSRQDMLALGFSEEKTTAVFGPPARVRFDKVEIFNPMSESEAETFLEAEESK